KLQASGCSVQLEAWSKTVKHEKTLSKPLRTCRTRFRKWFVERSIRVPDPELAEPAPHAEAAAAPVGPGEPQRAVLRAYQPGDRHLIRDDQHDPSTLPCVRTAPGATGIWDRRWAVSRRGCACARRQRIRRRSLAAPQRGRCAGLCAVGRLQ